MKIIAADTETFRFGEQPDGTFLIHPRIICTSWAMRETEGIKAKLVSDGDGDAMKLLWLEWLNGHDLLVFHNAGYDLGVCCATWPELETLVWDKLERGEITCTMVREKLLNLSSHGNLEYVSLPDGSTTKLGYALGDLAMNYLGLDMGLDKEEDSVRTQYDLYSGMPSRNYPAEARTYALQDAHVPMAIYEAQASRVRSHHGPSSLSTEFFQTACAFALSLMTEFGMRIDEERFQKLKAEMERVLHEDNLRPVIRAGIVRPAEPARPQLRQISRATELLAAEFGDIDELMTTIPTEEGPQRVVDWAQLTDLHLAVLLDDGIKLTKPKKSSMDRGALCALVVKICEEIGVTPKLTKTGGICADAEVIQELVAFDQALDMEEGDELLPDGTEDGVDIHPRRMTPMENYQYRQDVQKIVTTELPRMLWGHPGKEKPAKRVYFNFNVLLASGRTSSFASKHYPSGNGQQVDPRGRPCYLPEEGQWLLSADYGALELCSVAQTTFELFGQSRHRDLINSGMDLHCNLGSSLANRLPSEFTGSYEDFLKLKATNSKFFKHWRKFAKPVGLGYPGGLGANTFMSLAKKTYGVDIMKAAQTFPEDALPGPDNTTVAWHARKVGITISSGWRWTPFLKGIALAVLLKQVWLDTYPEMVAYFDWVTKQKDDINIGANNEGRTEHMLCYTTPMGMHRAGASFTAVANGRAMQSPAAEGAKTAVYRIMKECRVGRLKGVATFPNFIHDEVLLSIPADPDAAASVTEIVEAIMIDSMQNVMPDVRISVESALMTRWRKEAEPVRSRKSGLLLPWEPDVEHEVDADGSIWLP